jgi:nucleotide-binding universal stress UspA family protein
MKESAAAGSVVVGIDGSKAAIRAALWAVDEAVGRDAALRLLCAIEQGAEEPDGAARRLASAEIAIGRAFTAIEATGQPVKIETEIAQGPPIASLLRASASAAMVCVGAVGLRHFLPGRVGSTAAALATSAKCPVAIIGSHDNHSRQPAHVIVVEADASADHDVLLSAAMEEARARNAAIRAITCWHTASEGNETERDRDRRELANLDRRLARWRRRYPSVEVESVAVHGSLVDYLAHDRLSMGLVIVGAHNREHLKQLGGPVSSAILQDAECSLLIVNGQHL